MRKSEIDKKFDEIVDFSGIEKFIDTPVKRYSSGIAVRLAFSVAAHLEPEILLIDEVLAVGDAEFQKKCLGKMDDIAETGRTILFVSHNMTAVQNLCKKGILLDSGKIVLDSDINSVVKKYLSKINSYSGQIEWNESQAAPGNERVRLNSVRISSSGICSGSIDIDKEINIEVDYSNLDEGAKLQVSIHVYNSSGVMIFSSSNIGSVPLEPDVFYNKKLSVGKYRTICKVPPYFFNDGTHSVSIFIGTGSPYFKNIFKIKDVLGFEIIDGGAMRKEYMGSWHGIVRPRLFWSTKKVD